MQIKMYMKIYYDMIFKLYSIFLLHCYSLYREIILNSEFLIYQHNIILMIKI